MSAYTFMKPIINKNVNENITQNEIFNDGKTIHLYFDGMTGLYVAYGISAYLLWKYASAKPSYSEEMQMPVAVINTEQYEKLEKQVGQSSTHNNYRCLETEEATDMDDYSNWAFKLRGNS